VDGLRNGRGGKHRAQTGTWFARRRRSTQPRTACGSTLSWWPPPRRTPALILVGAGDYIGCHRCLALVPLAVDACPRCRQIVSRAA